VAEVSGKEWFARAEVVAAARYPTVGQADQWPLEFSEVQWPRGRAVFSPN